MKRATVYFDEQIHRALKLKAIECESSLSDMVNKAVRAALEEDLEDLTAIEDRKQEKPISYEKFLKELKSRAQI